MSEAISNGPGLADIGDALIFGADNGALGPQHQAIQEGPGIMAGLDSLIFEPEAG